LAEKYTAPSNAVKSKGSELLGPGAMSPKMEVPPRDPSLIHGSIPEPAPRAARDKVPSTFASQPTSPLAT
jgi:hypothetical protein